MKKLLCLTLLCALGCPGQMMQAIVGASPMLSAGCANGYSKCSVFTFNVYPASNLTDFPNLILGTYAQLADVAHGGYVQHTVTLNGQTVPADLIFTSDSAGSTLLSWEIESWSNTTGAIVAWVKANRSSSADTLIYVWVGKSSIATYQCTASATWDSNYASVWHLPNGATLSTLDSTSNANNASGSSLPSAASGNLDGGASFNGSGNYLLGANTVNTSTATVSVWVYLTAYPAVAGVIVGFTQGNGSGTTEKDLWVNYAGTVVFYTYNGGAFTTAGAVSPLALNQWNYIVGTVGSNGQIAYMNGVPVGTVANTGSFTGYSGANILAGGYTASYPYLSQQLADFRVSLVQRSADWIAHEYTQQSHASPWYTVGSWM